MKWKTESNCCDVNSIEFSNKSTFRFTSFGCISTVSWALRFQPWALADKDASKKGKAPDIDNRETVPLYLQQANLDDLKLMRRLEYRLFLLRESDYYIYEFG